MIIWKSTHDFWHSIYMSPFCMLHSWVFITVQCWIPAFIQEQVFICVHVSALLLFGWIQYIIIMSALLEYFKCFVITEHHNSKWSYSYTISVLWSFSFCISLLALNSVLYILIPNINVKHQIATKLNCDIKPLLLIKTTTVALIKLNTLI